MSGNLLQTKLYVPKRPLVANGTSLIPRPHLIEKLNQGLHRKLTLISAPAGFGKTTLINGWLQQLDRPTAWVSSDDGDNEPTRFLAYILAALQTAVERMGKTPALSEAEIAVSKPLTTSLSMLQSPQPLRQTTRSQPRRSRRPRQRT